MRAATGAKGRADRLFSQRVRARGRCQRCGSTRNLQCAHIIARRYANTRCQDDNAWCLCAGCHRWLTDNPFEHVAFAWQTIGEARYRELLELAQSRKRVDWAAVCEALV